MMKSSEPYQQSLERTQADARVQALLGTPITSGFTTTGNIQLNNDSGQADISYTVSGPQGSGTVHVVAEKAGGAWTYSKMTFSNAGEEIDLLPVGTPTQ